jgi:hypothetical protein
VASATIIENRRSQSAGSARRITIEEVTARAR